MNLIYRLLGILCLGSTLLAAPADSLQNQPQKDSAVLSKSIPMLRNHGQQAMSALTMNTITKQDLQWINYLGAQDILCAALPAIPLHTGEPGQFSSFSIMGCMPHSIQWGFNGRPLNDPGSGLFNAEQMPPELIEKMQVYTGADAAVLAGAAGAYVAVQGIQYSSAKPFTRFWYSQAGYDYIASDGTFAQNISPEMNIMLGFRRYSANGRFAQAGADQWNLRAALRWSMDSLTTVSLTEVFTNHGYAQNAGIDPASASFNDPLTATIRVNDIDERVYRHDLTLSGTRISGPDTNWLFTSSIWVSAAEWNKNRGAAYRPAQDSIRLISWNTLRSGAMARWEQKLGTFMQLTAGGLAEYIHTGESWYTQNFSSFQIVGFGHLKYQITPAWSIRGGIRAQASAQNLLLSTGAAMLWKNGDLSAEADISRIEQVSAPMQNKIPYAGIQNILPERHTVLQGRIEYKKPDFSFGIFPFFRIIQNEIRSQALYDTSGENLIGAESFNSATINSVAGAGMNAGLQLWKSVDLQLFIHAATASAQLGIPQLYTSLNAMYTYRQGRSMVSGGFRIRAARQNTMGFNPFNYAFISGEYTDPGFGWNGLDLTAVASLGNARIRATLFNLLGSTMMDLAGYPIQDNVIRISVSWSFDD